MLNKITQVMLNNTIAQVPITINNVIKQTSRWGKVAHVTVALELRSWRSGSWEM